MQENKTSFEIIIPDPNQLDLFGNIPGPEIPEKDYMSENNEVFPHIRSPDDESKEAIFQLNENQKRMARVLTAKSRALHS
jgi:hypothetical protein